MYLEYFGLTEPPFSIAPDPRYLFMSERHREALAHLLYGVQGQGGFIVLTGEVGTGKTTICRCFLNQVPNNTDVAFIVNPKLSAHELLASICDELHISYAPDASIKGLNDALNDYLLAAHSRQRHTVLIIDEAQNLDPEVLEQLRLLTNLETSEKKLLQIILLGQPELRDILAKKELRQLAQRVTARYHLDGLNRVEVGAYVSCRLSVAGRKQRVFSDGAIKALYKYSGGIPRLINLLSDRALLGAYASHSEFIEAVHVKRAHYEIQGEDSSFWTTLVYKYGYRVISVSLALLLFIGLGMWSKPFLETVSPVKAKEYTATSPENDLGEMGSERIESYDRDVGVLETPKSTKALEELGPTGSNAHEGSAEYLENFADALSSSSDSLVAYVEAPTPDTKLFGDISEPTDPSAVVSGFALVSELGKRSRGVKDKLQAFQSVFETWNINYAEEPFRLACEFAALNGLACLHKQGNWRSLLRIDRPAVLTLFNDDGQKIHLALLKIDADVAHVSHRGERFKTTLDEIDRFWLGEYSVIWKLPPYKSGIVRPGQPVEGEWLQSGLARINPELEGMPLKDQLVEFQRAMGLVPDGIAGSMTLIQMNNALQTATPKLLGST